MQEALTWLFGQKLPAPLEGAAAFLKQPKITQA